MKQFELVLTFVFVAALVFGGVAGAQESTYFATLPGQNMSVSPSGAGAAINDSNAWGGQALMQRTNGTATGSVTANEGTHQVVLRARSSYCQGWSRATVKVDGVTIISDQLIDSSSYEYYSVDKAIPAGTHQIQTVFANDHAARSCDRNLIVDQVALQRSRTAEEPVELSSGTLTFGESFDRDADSFIPPWDSADLAYGNRLTTDSSVVRAGTHSAKFSVHDSDVSPRTYSENPRAQLNKNNLYCEGDDRYIRNSVFFPADFPTLPSSGWLIFSENGFAPPYGSTARQSLVVTGGDRVELHYKRSGVFDRAWRTTLERGQWTDYIQHIKFSSDPTVGFIEVWKNGRKQTFTDGSQRIYRATLDPAATACGNNQTTSYRQKGMFEWVTLYQDEVKVGDSYAAVASE